MRPRRNNKVSFGEKRANIDWVDILYKISSLFTIGLDINIDKILENVLDKIGKRIRASMLAVWLLDEKGYVYISASYKLPKEYIDFSHTKEGFLKKDEGMIGRAIKEKKPVFRENIFEIPEAPRAYLKMIKDLNIGVYSLLASPLIVEGKVIGTFNFYFKHIDRDIGEKEKKIIKIISDQIATFIKNLQMYKQIRQKTIDLKEEKERVEQEKNKTRATLVNLPNGLIVFDKQERITLINPEAERTLNLKESEVINKKISQISRFPNLTKLYRALGKKIEWTGQKYELILNKPLRRFFQVSVTPVVIKRETIGLMIILHDVTREKEIERLKTEFVSISAHQLRTPLSAIKWTLRMLLDGDVGNLTLEQLDFLKKGYESNERMINLVNDLLNVARIEEGRFIYDLTPQSLEEIIGEAIDQIAAIIKVKKIKIVFNKPKQALPKIEVDKEKISIVVQSLIDNAIRFNEPGGEVTISIKYDKFNLEVMVKDTGIGIPQDQQKRIFDKFFRANNAARLETEGTGLGLFICKNIIEAHSGKIWFESKENQGTAFWFSLPIKQIDK